MRASLLLRLTALLALTSAAAIAQQFSFELLVTSGTQQFTAANGSTLTFQAEIGHSVSAHVVATYFPASSTSTATITQPPQLLGATQFSIMNFPNKLPLQLNPGDQFSFDIAFKSTSANVATAQLTIRFNETVPQPNGPPATVQNAIVLVLQGASPLFQLFYVLQSNPNVVSLPPGGTIPFGPTLVDTTTLANLDIFNAGSGPGQIQSISFPTDPAFKLTGVPALPTTVASAGTLTLQIAYTPTAATTDTDQIQITLASGTVLTVMLQGNGIAASYSYTLLTGDTPAPVTPPGPIALPDTAVGSTSSVTVRVQNVGSAKGVLNTPSLSGPAFQLGDLPLFPQTLNPNDSFTFTINFTPTQPGPAKGNLIVGSDLFSLTGNGLGSKLAFSYSSVAGTIQLNNGDSVIFSPVEVTQSENATFTITNNGTQQTTISNITIGESKSPFSITGLPPIPTTLAPGASMSFTLRFAPSNVGLTTGTLHIDGTSVGLMGSGTQPPPLPSYTIQGPNGTVAPQTQPSISLALANPYPVAVAGTLALTTNGNVVADPAVQFSTGGKTVSFVIPANSTSANFAGQGSQIFLQSGTVAENIILTPSFQTQDGAIDLTPSSATALQFSVPAAAPTLLGMTITNASGTTTTATFTLNVIGLSTTRMLNSMTIQFTAATGYNLGTSTQTTVDLHSSSAAWYQSSASQSFGGQFEVSIPFTLTGTVPTGQTLLQAIGSISATVSNDVGTSAPLQIKLQ
ncbi:MAG TPA: choice-of-anchor D domain-containing protein [Bryobacteraceae bacterium]|nr:choice-of-anchor D domain-containing protein [Bryobacteraceae bacterium]